MKYYESTKIMNVHHGAVIVIGKFDGLHLGHRLLIEKARAVAKKHSLPLGALTFTPHPTLHFQRKKPEGGFLITPDPIRIDLFRALGFDFVASRTFDAEFSRMRSHQFVQRILKQDLEAAHIVVGENFQFGKNREGNIAELVASGDFIIHPVVIQSDDSFGDVISATKIRNHLKNGEIEAANEKLGHGFTIVGKVFRNRRLGSELGHPTANILPMTDQILPKFGVYAARVLLEDGRLFDAALNWGKRPSVNSESSEAMYEAHLLDFNEDIYNQEIRLNLIEYIRPEKKFSGLNSLKEQIQKDCQGARRILHNYPKEHVIATPVTSSLSRDLIPHTERTMIEAATFRRLVQHFHDHPEVQNIDLMLLANFCRNCLSSWYRSEAEKRGFNISKEESRQIVYRMSYDDWKTQHQSKAEPEKIAALQSRHAQKTKT